jgi:hypothetical protein
MWTYLTPRSLVLLPRWAIVKTSDQIWSVVRVYFVLGCDLNVRFLQCIYAVQLLDWLDVVEVAKLTVGV